MQVQAGAAHTVGEAKFFDLISPAAAVNIGYQFAPPCRKDTFAAVSKHRIHNNVVIAHAVVSSAR